MSPDSTGRRRLLGGRAKPNKPAWTGPDPIAARLSYRSQISQVRAPSSEVGPEPVFVPVTGYSVLVEFVASGDHPVSVLALRAEVTERAAIEFDGTARSMPSMPDMIGSADLAETVAESVANYRPLDQPHLEVLLDDAPPTVRHAQGTAQPAVRFPITLQPGQTTGILIAPVTADPGLTSWNLLADWDVAGFGGTIPWPLTVTASTGMTSYHPGGRSEPTPVDRVAADHWVPGTAAG